MPLHSGTRLGPYEIVAPIGAGGMGEVYRARDTRLERTVAVKVLPAHLSAIAGVAAALRARGADDLAALPPAHLRAVRRRPRRARPTTSSWSTWRGRRWRTGSPEGRFRLEQVLRFGCEIADALDKAHRQGIVHRDLKPGNVMLTKSGVKLLDFGLAKGAGSRVRRDSSSRALPTAGRRLSRARARFSARSSTWPRSSSKGSEADARTDIFALGAVLYEMATGAKAFAGTSQASLIGAILRDTPRPISDFAPVTPPALDRIVRTCLAKDPEDRWQTARDVSRQLREVEKEPFPATPAAATGPRRSRWWAVPWAVALIALALAAAVGKELAERG